MVLGSQGTDELGRVLLYQSTDLRDWQPVSVLDKSSSLKDEGYMWECPDDLTVGGRRFLSVSPQGIGHEKYVYQNVYSSGYFELDGDLTKNYREWDCGFDFYAPQTFEAPDGRRILIGWEGIGDIPYTNPTAASGWQHCLTLPRELTLSENGAILQRPVREMEKLRKNGTGLRSGDNVDLPLPFEITGEVDSNLSVVIKETLVLRYNDGEFELSFLSDEVGCGRTKRYAKIDVLKNIRIIADTSSIEIYLNDGETVLSSRMYPAKTVLSANVTGINGSSYELEGIKIS